MKNVKAIIKNNWLTLLIGLFPILDMLNYFFIETRFNIVFTISRFVLLFILFLYSFIVAEKKKGHVIFSTILLIYTIGHLISSFISGYISPYQDLSNLLRIYNMPILLFAFFHIFKQESNPEKKVVSGMKLAFSITLISIIVSIVTNTANYTYGTSLDLGVIGWFFNKNAQSMILVVLCLVVGSYSLRGKWYYPVAIIITVLLFYNATKTALFSLIAYLFILTIYSALEFKDIRKTVFSGLLLVTVILNLNNSPMYKNYNIYFEEQTNKNENTINPQPIKPGNNVKPTKPSQNGNNNNNNSNSSNNSNTIKPNQVIKPEEIKNPVLKEYDNLYRSYDLGTLIDNFGIEKVLQKYEYTTDSFILSNVRTQKKTAASLIFNQENEFSHFFGFEFTKINNMQNQYGQIKTYDLENDFTALFYYLGYIGFILYVGFILYFIIKMLIILIKNIKYAFKIEYAIWTFLIVLLLVGAEYNGSLLRRPNANLYLSLVLSLSYLKFMDIKNKLKNNKITFLALHLGYGGIESSTINTANTLSEKYEIEIISFYKLKDNQEHLINSNIKVKYLCKTEPNREKFKLAVKNKDIINIIKEGIKAIRILLLKKLLIIKEIINCDSKFIVSTRWDFSTLLSSFKSEHTIAIAQEHHHHNNDRKYINTLKQKYKRIDYLFALTKNLAEDYKNFLKNNKKIKITVVPNMLTKYPREKSLLKENNIISVGRLHPGKRVTELVDIVKINKNVKQFFIIGDGDEYKNVESKIKEFKLEKRVQLLGYKNQDEIGKYLKESSIFVMASITEGLPMVLLEAMSYGVPCIAYRTDSGVNDIIDNGKNGYIIENRDKEEFSNKIDKILKDKKLKEQFSKNAIEKSKDFSSESILKKWDHIINLYN